ncbi:iron-sulfur cluster biosynthesis protein [Lentzea sp. NEAU-D7]|uniref:iron-sulfur cluster biosynthesis protein n=1 Tax=Lentzea sp. NEAU-D7 TaxID=2994667 RepID=UPI00224AF313|nr:iron-sulfur cluster biosynthesis protein [Lentzea sp. NEAU-D7]MCX2948884.1 iron-sulfur cluster biosynthesis protein [Lentzea sp. NEAU-D7]
MLDVTANAGEAINTLASSAGTSDSAGIRISVADRNDQGADLALTMTSHPLDGDQVVVGALGSHVFLEPEAAEILDNHVLDARRAGDGEIQFALRVKA